MKFWQHRGFWNVSVHYLAADGIQLQNPHLDARPMRKYCHSIKNAIIHCFHNYVLPRYDGEPDKWFVYNKMLFEKVAYESMVLQCFDVHNNLSLSQLFAWQLMQGTKKFNWWNLFIQHIFSHKLILATCLDALKIFDPVILFILVIDIFYITTLPF